MADGTAPLIHPPAELTERIARKLRIVEQKTGEWRIWVPTTEQRALWRATQKHPYVYALKPRQVGATTAILLEDLLFVILNEQRGNVVRVGLVWDTDPKAVEQLARIADFARQLGFTCEPKTHEISFPGGSKIEAFTAGGKRVGASLSFHRLHISELPFWRDAQATMNALMPAMVMSGRIVIETTMGLAQPVAIALWREPGRFERVFFSVEEHEAYRGDPKDLPHELETWLRAEGFTSREVMAFLAMKLKENGGDRIELLREYPRTPAQAFASADGRWVKTTPAVVEPVRVVPIQTTRIELVEKDGAADVEVVPHVLTAPLKVFREPSACSGQVLIGVDTAAGVGAAASTVVVVDKKDQALVATFYDAECTADDLAAAAHLAWTLYTKERSPAFQGGKAPAPLRPVVVIEVNGVGITTFQRAVALGISTVVNLWTEENTAYDGLLAARRVIEAGRMKGPKELADECDELHVKNGKFKGPKDLLMAIGFCLNRLAVDPYKAPAKAKPKNVLDLEKLIGPTRRTWGRT